MTYLSAERAAKVTVLAGMIAEPNPDGSILMIDTETRLDLQDRAHM